MIEHIKVFKHKGLVECKLPNLGKINVICGKNNSGKSTLLEAITSSSNSKLGVSSNSNLGLTITDNMLSRLCRVIETPYDPHRDKLSEMVSNKAWYADESVSFVSTFLQAVGDQSRSNRELESAYKNLFSLSPPPKIVLLPPKRRLEIVAPIGLVERAQPEGAGIINCLFNAKNLPENSNKRQVFNLIAEAFRQVSSGYSFDIFMPEESSRGNLIGMSFSLEDQSWIDAKDSGLGLQDLLVILYFSLSPDYDVVLIEEPENHMHPDMQRRLIYLLHNETNKQFFLSTHSNVFLNSTLVDRVFFAHFDGSVKVDDATSKAAILQEIGYDVTDNLVSDLVILVEGPKDKPVIEAFLTTWGLSSQYNIKIWPLGGDIMDQLDLSIFAENYAILALIDRDPYSQVVRERFIANCKQYNIPVHRLKRYAVENYFSLRALREVFGAEIPSSVSTIDPDKKLEDQIGINVKRKNGVIAQNMTREEIENTDFGIFMKKVETLCKNRETGAKEIASQFA